MGKTVKHRTTLPYADKDKTEGYEHFEFICRGCTINRFRVQIWHGFLSSIEGFLNREIDNSYLFLEEEPSNRYDPNAIMVVCGGEFFGTVGYVGREFTLQVKEILKQCQEYRLDMVDESEVGNKEVKLKLTWKS